MHTSALKTAASFFSTYMNYIQEGTVIEIGSQNVGNGSLREVCPPKFKYVGVDFVAGNGVDVILEDAYKFPFEDGTADVMVCSSCFEHSEFFWLSFLEMLRVVKDDGLIYINAPSNGLFHRFPTDCWRFYPDSGLALARWGARNGYDPLLLESFIARQDGEGMWNDFVAVFVKNRGHAGRHPARIIDTKADFTNAHRDGRDDIINHLEFSEDHQKILVARRILDNEIRLGVG